MRSQEEVRRDPVGFCRQVLGFEPWSKQREVIESVRDHRRTAVRSCHGAGKTAIAARTVLWFLASHRDARVVTTAPTLRQVRDVLWREIARGFRESQGFFVGELFDTRLELGPGWFAIGESTDKPERFQGHHAEHLLFVVDEAAGVGDDIFEASSGFLTSEGARTLLIGNPTVPSGEFFDAFHRSRGLYNTIAVSAFDTPAFTGERVSEMVLRQLVTRQWVEDAARRWGEASPIYEARVLGTFPSSTDDTVSPLGEVEAAVRREVIPAVVPVTVACDVARFGSDETVIVVRRGGHVRVVRSYRGRDTVQTVGELHRVVRELRAAGTPATAVIVDDVGVGGGVTDLLRDQLRNVGLPPQVVAFNGGARARRPRDYPNRRSEAWFNLASRLPELDLEDDQELIADLVAPRYVLDAAGRRVVEAKKDTKRRLGRSPDRGDAVVMAFAADHGYRGAADDGSLAGAEDADPSPADLHGAAGLRFRRSRSEGGTRFLRPGSPL